MELTEILFRDIIRILHHTIKQLINTCELTPTIMFFYETRETIILAYILKHNPVGGWGVLLYTTE